MENKIMKKLLFIDDDKALHALIRAAFAQDACTVLSSYDPVQGLAVAKKEKPDLIILDVMMPAGGGVDFYKRIRNLSNLSHIPILIFSAKAKAEIIKLLPTADPNLILTKPAKPSDIRDVVSSIGALSSRVV